jgi:hypothetical protein
MEALIQITTSGGPTMFQNKGFGNRNRQRGCAGDQA